MKRILITGVNSYLGKRFKDYMAARPGYATVSISMRDGSWRNEDFRGFDVIYHVAGLAHSDSGRISKEKAQKYYEINTELTEELAKKAKREGVGQFIFMSSAIVYGDSAPLGSRRRIAPGTRCTPANCYSDSKLQAEERLKKLADERFKQAQLFSVRLGYEYALHLFFSLQARNSPPAHDLRPRLQGQLPRALALCAQDAHLPEGE